ncbi:mannitol-1-phosphate 5-dehydrogenase [Vararia minispora EC-137]|uniref:Mannitol-1-phosphate 5-dehydrogenase n=1 Tax=Vararia minispora EC-137 TaxID=1314806 RepID=A0ACB8QJS2_9AGAM|nr:mannitol-1-phosphate 5-dehydrogenase [Vararia minispora EC-137]
MPDDVAPPNKPIALHFGAGNIGRGFIGALLADSGYHVIFSDVNQAVVDALNHEHAYRVDVLDQQEFTKTIKDVEAVKSESQDVVRDLAHPNTRIVTTAVGVTILQKIAPTIANGLQERRRVSAPPFNVVACENMVNQTEILKDHVYKHLPEEHHAWADEHVGFANCSVDRIVPGGRLDEEHPLDVGVEAFFEWVVHKPALRAPIDPVVQSMVLTDKLDAYIERKLFTLNCGHAATAYLGHLRGHHTIDRAIADPEVARIVRGGLEESGAALVRRHGFNKEEHAQYIDRIIDRFKNPKLSDRLERVGKQPVRKLGRQDRLLGPTYMAREYELPIDNLARIIAAAFLFDVKDDEESVQLIEKVQKVGVEDAVAEMTGFKTGTDEHRKVVEGYHQLQSKK